MTRTPCYKCKERHAACHTVCEKYEAFHVERIEAAKQRHTTLAVHDLHRQRMSQKGK